MSKAKHTPGPWKALSQHYRNGQTLTEGNHWWVEGPHGTIGMDERTCESAEKNARLMAAAPDLYAACKAALPHLDYEHVPDDVWQLVTSAIRCAEFTS